MDAPEAVWWWSSVPAATSNAAVTVNRVLLCKAGAHVGAGGQVERGEALPRDELHTVEAADLGFGRIVVS